MAADSYVIIGVFIFWPDIESGKRVDFQPTGHIDNTAKIFGSSATESHITERRSTDFLAIAAIKLHLRRVVERTAIIAPIARHFQFNTTCDNGVSFNNHITINVESVWWRTFNRTARESHCRIFVGGVLVAYSLLGIGAIKIQYRIGAVNKFAVRIHIQITADNNRVVENVDAASIRAGHQVSSDKSFRQEMNRIIQTFLDIDVIENCVCGICARNWRGITIATHIQPAVSLTETSAGIVVVEISVKR